MNAIILAAGLGSRFKEKTVNNHKALLPIGGKPNIERTIEFLIEKGIKEVVIVVGHMAQLFDYLETKYAGIVKLVYNAKYAEYNSIYSFYLASEFFGNTFVIDCDVVLFKNLFSEHQESCYYTILRKPSENNEWIPILNEEKHVKEIRVSNQSASSLLGISYWTHQDAEMIKNHLSDYMTERQLLDSKSYWDDIPRSLINKMKVKPFLIDSSLAGEMDNWEEYTTLKNYGF